MNVVWPVTALYAGPPAAYFMLGRSSKKATHRENSTSESISWKNISVGAFHCGAGCTLGDVAAEWRLDLVVEFFNLFNHPNVVAISPSYGSGVTPISTFSAPRQVRFSIDFEF